MNIILIGFMGSGKTSLGIRLSYHMKRVYLDTDKEIEKKQGKRISEIFAEAGEAAFRQMETDYLSLLLERKTDNHIISTGGGTPLREENTELLKKLGIVVWLRIRPETVYERLKGDTTRPLLQGSDPETRIRELIAAREPLYDRCADVVIDVDDKPTQRIMDEVFTKSAGARKRWKKRRS